MIFYCLKKRATRSCGEFNEVEWIDLDADEGSFSMIK